ncbi:MAG: hypothetical protein IJ194_03650 [Bacilli bacterium]|nr:hypothetical protein [Bacilli bacterium]
MTFQIEELKEKVFEEQLHRRGYDSLQEQVQPIFEEAFANANQSKSFSTLPFFQKFIGLLEMTDLAISEVLFYQEFHQEKPSIEVSGKKVAAKYLKQMEFENSDSFKEKISPVDPRYSVLKNAADFFASFNAPFARMNPDYSLINDLFQNTFIAIRGICENWTLGNYAEAFIGWRNVHETECILTLLINGSEELKQTYIYHIAYNNFLRNKEAFDPEFLNAAFEKMKSEMAQHGLKSKDMKKFIEYGWLYKSDRYDENDKDFKLNFRDGLERAAGLSELSGNYEVSSEITHSSAFFFYSVKEYLKIASLSQTYDSALRIFRAYLDYAKFFFSRNKEQEEIGKKLVRDCEVIKLTFDDKENEDEQASD